MGSPSPSFQQHPCDLPIDGGKARLNGFRLRTDLPFCSWDFKDARFAADGLIYVQATPPADHTPALPATLIIDPIISLLIAYRWQGQVFVLEGTAYVEGTLPDNAPAESPLVVLLHTR